MTTTEGGMEERLARVETKVDALQIQFEQVREDIKKLGEGYEQGLKDISNQIKELDRSWADNWSPHDLAPKDHAKRIAILERERLEPR